MYIHVLEIYFKRILSFLSLLITSITIITVKYTISFEIFMPGKKNLHSKDTKYTTQQFKLQEEKYLT